MSARYWVLASDELMAGKLRWPDGLRVVEPQPLDQQPQSEWPGMRWWLLEDDGAPASLGGKQVELSFTRCADKVMIGSRSPAI